MRRALRSVWSAPRPAHPSPPALRDWVLVAVVVGAALVEGLLRDDVTWRAVAVVMVAGLAFTLPWRRTRPFAMFLVGFGVVTAVQVVAILSGVPGTVGLNAGLYMLLLVYAVMRWGSGREAVIAVGVLVVVVALGRDRDWTSTVELLLEIAVLGIAGVSGLAVRAQAEARGRELGQVRLAEREQLARELHDTVAHHVTAMVVRAQAGRLVAADDPAAAVEALVVIEAEGRRTLAEMRVLVGALRDGGEADVLAPRTVADIASLAGPTPAGVVVSVDLADGLDDLHPSVGAALYRIAQESVTNAARHAQGSTAVDVVARPDGEHVVLRVADDGAPVAPERVRSGYGLVGMTERVALLGGTLTAGPAPGRGWVVEARVPRTGVR